MKKKSPADVTDTAWSSLCRRKAESGQLRRGAIDILVQDKRKGGTDISPTDYGEKLVCSSYLFGL